MITQRLKAYQLVSIQLPTSTRRRVVETISYPFPANEDGTGDQRIKVRMVPGDPTTLSEVALADLKTCERRGRYCHIAEVHTSLRFPEDMLRYDGAALYNHTLSEEGELHSVHGYRSDKPILIYQVSENRKPAWTFDRWASFGASVKHLHTTELGSV